MSLIPWLSKESYQFPPTSSAMLEPNGLLAVGGDLSATRLVKAYSMGIFPWFSEMQPILWWSPDPRSVLIPDKLHISRSLRKSIRQGIFKVSADRAFTKVVECCSQPRGGETGTWITAEMKDAYSQLHDTGIAHSIEVWDQQNNLVGGLYGVALGKVFFGESMFSIQTDASKVAVVAMVSHLQRYDFSIIDCQIESAHLNSLGATNISRQHFESILDDHIQSPAPTQRWSDNFCWDNKI